MSITKENIKNLAELARIKISDEELGKMTVEVSSILDYVGQIQGASFKEERVVPKHRNIFREDEVTTKDDEYTEKLLQNAPEREGRYFKVKKIL